MLRNHTNGDGIEWHPRAILLAGSSTALPRSADRAQPPRRVPRWQWLAQPQHCWTSQQWHPRAQATGIHVPGRCPALKVEEIADRMLGKTHLPLPNHFFFLLIFDTIRNVSIFFRRWADFVAGLRGTCRPLAAIAFLLDLEVGRLLLSMLCQDRPQLLDAQCRGTAVQDRVAIWTDRSQICHGIDLVLLAYCRQFSQMVDVNHSFRNASV